MRIVSLLPSSTEIVAALGLASDLVGRSHECDYPAEVNTLPILSEAKTIPKGDSAAIDQSVRNLVKQSLSIYTLHADLLNDLAPDVILTQSQCEVCAVNLNEVQAAVKQVVTSEPEIVDLKPDSYDDIFTDITKIGQALRRVEEAKTLINTIQARIGDVHDKITADMARPRVACLEWLDPIMNAANWMPNLVEKAGGTNLFGEAGAHSQPLTWEEIQAADPDILVIMPCGYGIAQSRNEMKHLTKQPGWKELKAVKSNKVFLVDGNQYFNRPGPRIADSVEILAEIFHPTLFAASYAPNGWMQYREVYI
jgi:iron complex transport system substrate-binding protein